MIKINPIPLWFALVLLGLCLGARAGAQKDTMAVTFSPYSSFRGHFAVYDNEMVLQENASRAGMKIDIRKGSMAFLVGAEFQINMFKGGSSFNADGNLAGGFLVIRSSQTQQVFGNRQGYLGLDMGGYGALTFGKQWSVYSDITRYTDKFNVFGGQASATYIGGTDGGENGTGRADQALIYRNGWGPLSIGAQIQARGAHNEKFIDGYGLSLQIRLMEGLRAGLAYNRTWLSEALIKDSGGILGLDGQPGYFSLGCSYTGRTTDIGIVAVRQANGDFVQGRMQDPILGTITPTVVFEAEGLELFARHRFQAFSLLGGYNLYRPATKSIVAPSGQRPVSTGFERSYIILGAEYNPLAWARFYAEQRIATGKTAWGASEPNVFALGLKIDVALAYALKVAP